MPGVLGIILLVMSLIVFDTLSIELGGVVLLVAAFVFFLIDLKVPSHGLATAAGIACFVLGGLFLYDSSSPDEVSRPLLIGMAVGLGLFLAVAVRAGVRARKLPVVSGVEAMIGSEAQVAEPLGPVGLVRLRGEPWARAPRRRPCRRGRAGRRDSTGPGDRRAHAGRRARAPSALGPPCPCGPRSDRPREDPMKQGRIRIALLPVKVMPEYQRLVVFRLGRMRGVKGPGVVTMVPLIDRFITVDLREFYLEIPKQTAITQDNAPISIDFITFFKVVDAQASVIAVTDFAGAAQNIAATTLRSVVGDISLDNVLARREEINEVLRTKLDEVTERWGVKVTTVEIREITPPPAVQEAMTRQMSAERTRRALVTEAEGDKAAAILRAEGDKQANILQAEGEKQSNILQAEGEKQAAALRAEGFALALTTVFEAARGVDAKTMGIQYLEALKALGASPSTKFVLPLELSSLLQGVAGYAGTAFRDGDRAVAAPQGGAAGEVPA